MRHANVRSTATASYGSGGPGLKNSYHRDRYADQTKTLQALSRTIGTGYHFVHVPFDTNDRYRYFVVGYRQKKGWENGFASDIVLCCRKVADRSSIEGSGVFTSFS
jgi:hypothetical protein